MEENVPLIPLNLPRLKKDLQVYLYTLIAMMVLSMQAYGQPVFLKHLAPDSRNFITSESRLFFSSSDSLFTSDGTPAGTVLVKKLGEPVIMISSITIGFDIFLVTQTGVQQSLWRSDGTFANTVKVGTYNVIKPLLAFQDDLYLAIDDGMHGNELWKLTPTNDLTMVKDINPGSGDGFVGEIIISDNTLFFKANAGISGVNLWKSDGTTAGTVLAVDLPFDDYYSLTDVNGTIFFTRSYPDPMDSFSQLAALWKTEGTVVSTILVKEFEPAPQYNELTHLIEFKGLLYFIRLHGTPVEHLMVSNGTEGGTLEIKHINTDGRIVKMIEMNNHLVFYGQSQGFPTPISKSDGTTAGTQSVHQLSIGLTGSIGGPNDPVNLTGQKTLLYFVDDDSDGGPSGSVTEDDRLQLFRSDLTSANTQSLRELYNVSLRGSDNVVGSGSNSVFFTTLREDQSFRLWYYDPQAPPLCAGAGSIVREFWTGVPGSSVSQIPTDTPPSGTETLTLFEGPTNVGNHYGSRIRGYLCVPKTGDYRFWIASNDDSELWLSTSADPGNKIKIADVDGYTNVRQYDKYPSQQSALINLTAGQLYYIEALHKEGVGTDHISVGMQLPDGTLERPIPGVRLIPYDDNVAPEVTITSPSHLQTFTAPATITIEVQASDADGTIEKVAFYNSTMKIGEDLTAPYSFVWNGVPDGDYSLTAKAFDNDGAMTISAARLIRVRNCGATGKITREVWTGISGSSVAAIPVDTPPDATNELTIFEGPSNIGTHYGTRIRGYICPPVSGTYVFYIASNDNSELWLSTDDDPANKIMIASVTGATNIRQWDKYASQQSMAIWLNQYERYYIEALHKQGVGTDNIAVGWTLPDGTQERPIPGSRLSPVVLTMAQVYAQGVPDNTLSQTEPRAPEVSLFPNPATRGLVTMTFARYGANEDVREVDVEILSSTGNVMYSGPVPCEGGCEAIELEITDKFSPGIYVVNGVINRKRFSRRLVIH